MLRSNLSKIRPYFCIVLYLSFINSISIGSEHNSNYASNPSITNSNCKQISIPYFKVEDFKPLKVRTKLSIESLLNDLYKRDSTSIISDFKRAFINPELFYYTPLNSIPINCKSDTIYIRFTFLHGEFIGTSEVNIWNSKAELSVCVHCKDYNYQRKLNFRDLERALIEDWNTDSICKLTYPSYKMIDTSYPRHYIIQIIIDHGTAKTRMMSYDYLYIPLKNNTSQKLSR